MTTGEKIQKLRKTSGMSQEQLAQKIAVSRQAISRWELDESRPDTENIMQVGKIFNVSTDFLLNDNIECEIDTPIVQQTSHKLKKQHTITITFMITILIVVAVVTVITKTLHFAMAVATIAFFVFIGYLLYLSIRFLRSFFR